MKLSTIINYTALAFFTLLVINDFFPSTILTEVFPSKLILSILVALVILQLVVTKGRESKLSIKQHLSLTIYIVGLWITLTLLGGHSQVGLSTNSPSFYMALLLLAYDLLRIYRKSKFNKKSMPN